MWKPIILDVECIVCNKSLQKINHDPREAKLKMGKIPYRRSRTPNWSTEEKKCLLELIKERKDVVTKNNNGPNYSEEKDMAWNEILRELSQRFGNKFTGSSIKKLKTQWQNMKRIAREEITLVGPHLEKFTRQSLEVCTILDMVKDGVLKRDNENFNDTVMTANIEIKAERLDEDITDVPNNDYSGMNIDITEAAEPSTQKLDYAPPNSVNNPIDLSEASANEFDVSDEQPLINEKNKKDASAMTEVTNFVDASFGTFQRQLQEFFKYSSDEKQLKMESLKEERFVIRAMRETAELNKIIAEQKLKHVLWHKKLEMT